MRNIRKYRWFGIIYWRFGEELNVADVMENKLQECSVIAETFKPKLVIRKYSS